jgi:hypothetical protein
VVSLASKVAPLVKSIHLPLSGLVVIDETYIKVKGKWHYLFTDKAPIYDVSVHSASVFFDASIRHRPVVGILLPPGGDPHTYKTV